MIWGRTWATGDTMRGCGIADRGTARVAPGPVSRNTLLVVAATFLFWAGTAAAEPLTLARGVKLATGQNRLIKIAEQQEEVSRAETFLARSPLLPRVDSAAGQTMLANQPGAIFGPQQVRTSEKGFLSFTVSVRQLLYDFQGAASRYRATGAVLETKQLDTLRLKNAVALDFAIVYFDLLEAEKMVLVAGREVERLEAHLRDARNLFEQGVITKNDMLQAEVRLSDARQRLLSSRNLRAITASRLNTVLARPLTELVEVLDVPDGSILPTEPDRTRAWEMALLQRAEMRIVDKTMESLGLEEKAVSAEYLPRFFAQGSFDYTENRYMIHDSNWALMVGMNLNLLSGGSTKAEMERVRAKKAQLLEQKARLADEIRLEVERQLLELRNALERMAVSKDAVGQAEENLRINRVRYEEGVGTATEVLDAVTLLTVAETNHFRALFDMRKAEAALHYAEGRDLTEVYR